MNLRFLLVSTLIGAAVFSGALLRSADGGAAGKANPQTPPKTPQASTSSS